MASAGGHFSAEGLDVEFVKLSNMSAAVPLLLRGRLDVLPGPASPAFLNAIAQGSLLRFVADKGHVGVAGCSNMSIVVRRGLLAASETRGSPPKVRRMSTSRETLFQYMLGKVLREEGLSDEDVEMVTVPAPAESGALGDGSIDAAFASDVWVTRLLDAGTGEVWIRLEDVLPGQQLSLISFGPRLLRDDPELGRRFMVAYLRGVRQFNEGPTARNLAILEAGTGHDRDALLRSCWPSVRDDGRIDLESVLEYQAWLLDRGLITEMVAEDRFWEPSFVEYANGVLGPGGAG
jgi:NitT/TauT family transport system substrate-binding protein